MTDQQPLLLGHRTRGTTADITVVARSHSLEPHIGKPWFNDYLSKFEDLVVDPPQKPGAKRGDPFTIDPAILATNAVLMGRPGRGKTYLAIHLLREQLKTGCSAVVLDVQEQTLRMAIQAALEAGMTADQITVIRTDSATGVPGWNPFDRPEEDRRAAVKQFVTLVLNIFGTGVRLAPLLKHAATLIASQRLSMVELVTFLAPGSRYRTGLLDQIAASADAHRYQYETEFFRRFSTWTLAKQEDFVEPVLARLSPFATEPFFQALLCARSDAIDFPSLWKRQRLVLVLLDEYRLGEEEIALTTSLFTYNFLATAMHHPKSDPVPVLLYVDEMGVQQKFSGEAVASIIAAARQKNVRVMAAFQYLQQLPERVLTAVLGSSCRVFFSLVAEDAEYIARKLITGNRASTSKIGVTAGSETYTVGMYVLDAAGHRITVGQKFWNDLVTKQEAEQIALLTSFAEKSGMGPLELGYKSKRLPLSDLPLGNWRLTERSPLTVNVWFPRPKVDTVTRKSEADQVADLQRTISSLPKQHAVIWVEGDQALIRVVDTEFPTDLPELDDFVGTSQSAENIAETLRWRNEQIAILSGGVVTPVKRKTATPAPPTVFDPPPLDVEDFGDDSL